jgi:hypothetical protein
MGAWSATLRLTPWPGRAWMISTVIILRLYLLQESVSTVSTHGRTLSI